MEAAPLNRLLRSDLEVFAQQREDKQFEDEQGTEHPHHHTAILGLALNRSHQEVEQNAEHDAVGNGVTDDHEDNRKDTWYKRFDLGPFKLNERLTHHNADDDQSRCRGKRGNGPDDGEERNGQQEENGGGDCGQPGTSTFFNTSGTFHKRGDG